MTYLPSLIKKIDEFYKLAAPPQAWSMPDDPEESPESDEGQSVPHFDELMNISHQVDDPGLAQQLRVLAELYRYAISMGGGYSTIARAITNLKNEYSDGADSNIEFILNGMIKELSKAAGGAAALSGKDNPNFVQRLIQLKQDIEDRERSAHSGAMDAYNEEINAPGATEETAEELAESGLTPEEVEIVNPAALGYGDKDNPRTNKGWHTVGSGKPYKNWREYYDAERASYEADAAVETNPNIKAVLTELISILPQLSDLTEATLKLAGELKVAPSEQGEAKKQEMIATLQKLKEKRQLLKNSIRSSTLQKDKQRLEEEKASARDPKVQMLLEQQIALKELALSSDVYKAKERNYRQALVDSMSGGNFPGLQTYNDFLQKIDGAKLLRVSKRDYDAKQSGERATEHGRLTDEQFKELKLLQKALDEKKISKQQYDELRWKILAKERGKVSPVVTREKGRRGGGTAGAKINQFDNDVASFRGVVQKYSDKVNSAIGTARDGLTQVESETGKKIHNEMKPIVRALGDAIQEKNDPAKFEAIRQLKSVIMNFMGREPALRVLERATRLQPYFNKIKEEFLEIAKWRTPEGAWNLSGEQQDRIRNILGYARRFDQIHNRYYPETPYNAAFMQLEALVARTEKETGVMSTVPLQTKRKRGSEDMPPTARMQLLTKLMVYESAIKLAQEVATPVGEVDEATADRLAQEIANKLLLEEFDNLFR